MKKADVLELIKSRPWYTPSMYLSTHQETRGTRHCILTTEDVIGWGFSWEAAIKDADRIHAKNKVES